MKLSSPKSDIYIPDGSDQDKALSRTTHLCISAHQDDMEIFAMHGIMECFASPDKWFTGVVVTNGSGSARSGPYADYTDEQMQKVRFSEQRKAAMLGEYSAMIQLLYTSSAVKKGEQEVVSDLAAIVEATRPQVLYLHNPADKHDTHIATLAASIRALRSLPMEARPGKVLGCEVWRGLDWMNDRDKEVLPVSGLGNLSSSLLGVFDSQIAGGKRYDLATIGRRLANATYFQSHEVDGHDSLTFAMDLTPLVKDDSLSLSEYTLDYIERFKKDVSDRIARFWED